MDQSTPSSVTSSNITTTSTIVTSTPASSKSVIVDPSSSDEHSAAKSALFSSNPSTSSSDQNQTPKRVSSSSTISSPLLTPPSGKIVSRNCNGTSECWKSFLINGENFVVIFVWSAEKPFERNLGDEKTRRSDERHRQGDGLAKTPLFVWLLIVWTRAKSCTFIATHNKQ